MKRSQSIFMVGLVAATITTHAASWDTWHLRQSPVTNVALNAVAYGNGQFVAVGEGGTVLTSPDGSNWISRVSGTTQNLSGVVCGSNLFVAVGDVGTTLASSNGSDWAVHVVPPLTNYMFLPSLVGITYGQGMFVAGGFYNSTDGTNWSVNQTLTPWPADSVSFGNGVFVGVVTIGGFSSAYLFTSTNGTQWSSRLWWPDFIIAKAIAFGAGHFVAVGGDNDPRRYSMITSVSTNGSDWSAQKVIGNTTFLRKVNYCGGLFFALGYGRVFSTSVDGFSWSTGMFPLTPALRSVDFGADTYVVVGDNGTILQSDPRSATPAPGEIRFTGVALGSSVRVFLSGPAGKGFQVEYADDLSANQNWHVLGQWFFPDTGANLFDTNAAPASQRFYRAFLLP